MNRTQKSTLSAWPEIALPALTLTFGLQTLRALLPYLQYLLGGRLGLTSLQLGLAALVIFATAFLTGRLNRWLGLRRLLLLSAGGVSLARLPAQLWTGDPLGDMILVMIGAALFILFLPTYLALVHWQGEETGSSQRFAQAILLGLIIDTSLHGLFLTYDLIWQAGTIPILLTGALALVQWVALYNLQATAPPHPMPVEGSLLATLPWLAMGPFLFLQLIVFQNQARLATLTGRLFPLVFAWVLISHLLGLGLATLWQPRKVGAAVMGVILVITLWPFEASGAIVFAVALLLGQVATAVLISTILRGLGAQAARVYYTIGAPHQPQEGLRNSAIVHGMSMILMVVLIFAFYVGFSLRAPYPNSWLLVLAGVIIGLSGIGATFLLAGPATRSPLRLTMALPWLLLLLLPFVFLTWRAPPVPNVSKSGQPIRVITYNIHNGFNPNGQLDMEALAQVIETEQPDIVNLQEVSRGWAINGSLDMLGWLSQRLDMPYVFAPAGDALWGQAVLSRYPIMLAETHPLPPRDIPLKRSFVYLQVDIGRPLPLQLVNTHLHHPLDDSDIRVTQVKTVLNFLANHPFNQVIMTGDLNATPTAPEIQLLYEHGFNDAVIEANLKPGYTVEPTNLYKRLDYILTSPDLTVTDVVIPNSAASDHLGIAATINVR